MLFRVLLAAHLASAVWAGVTGGKAVARDMIRRARFHGGLIVHVGCRDGRLTAALAEAGKCLTQGLALDPAPARAFAASRGLAGQVTIARWRGPGLPYVDNLVNQLVVEGSTPREEIQRVLRPGGAAFVKERGEWRMTVKPWPADIDEWTHFLRDASNNAVARDRRVGPPTRMQWLSRPLWTRNHHTLASISALVSAKGRVFYIVDEGPPGSVAMPPQWALVARDAFNGLELWRRPLPSWAWHRRSFRSGPVQLPRMLVASGDRVFAALGLAAPVSALDAASGRVERTFAGTERAEEWILHDGTLLVVTGSPVAEQAVRWRRRRRRKGQKSAPAFHNEKNIVAVRADTGETLWRWPPQGGADLMPLTLAAAGTRVFAQEGRHLVALDLKSGRRLWRAKEAARPMKRHAGWSVATVVAAGDVVLWADGRTLRALRADDGRLLWSCPCRPGFRSPADLFVIEGLVWRGPFFDEARDLHTGEVKRRSDVVRRLQTAGHHHRCHREKATTRYIITSKRGLEFFDLVDGRHSRNNWVRGLCQYGVMPCNGLVYAPPHSCGCYMEAKLFGFWALAASGGKPAPPGPGRRLERGPAFASLSDQKRQSAGRQAPKPTSARFEWPTYRHDAERSGSTPARVSPKLRLAWERRLGGRLSAPVAAAGLVLTAIADRCQVAALNAADGRVRWTLQLAAPVDSPPTLYRGLALFGCADGWAYAVRADTGALAWRFRAAETDRRTAALGRVESVWPLHGSVLVKNGVAYVAAGRCSYLDGGIALFGLDPMTGQGRFQTRLASAAPGLDPAPDKPADQFKPKRIAQNTVDFKTLTDPDKSDSFSMAGGATNDVLVSRGDCIFLRQVRFDARLRRLRRYAAHLFSTSSLLDGAEDHRSHWVLGAGDFRRLPVAYSWIANSKRNPWRVRLARPYGLLLAFDDHTVWGVRRGRYTLFSQPNRAFDPAEAPRPDFQPAEGKTSRADWTWSVNLPMRPRAMLRAGDALFAAGMAMKNGPDAEAAFEGRRGGVLAAFACARGEKLAQYSLPAPPVWDGLAATEGRLFLCGEDGVVRCFIGRP